MESWSFLEHSEENSLRTKGEERARGDLWEFGRQCGHFLLKVISWWSGGERRGSPMGSGLWPDKALPQSRKMPAFPPAGWSGEAQGWIFAEAQRGGGLHLGTEQEAETAKKERAEIRITVLFFKNIVLL